MIFQHDKVSFYYEIIGTGKPLCLLHGNGEDHTYFEKQLPFFMEQGYQCILMDMRGHGQSSLGEKDLDFTLFAKDVYALLQYLHIDRVCMLGFSDGANTLMQFALMYPQMMDALILNGGNLYLKGMNLRCQVAITVEYYVLCLLAKCNVKCKCKQKIVRLMAKFPNLKGEQLQAIHIPTLVIVGKKDMIKRSHSLFIKESIKDAKFVELVNGDHFIARKKANEYNREVLQFLKEVQYDR